MFPLQLAQRQRQFEKFGTESAKPDPAPMVREINELFSTTVKSEEAKLDTKEYPYGELIGCPF